MAGRGVVGIVPERLVTLIMSVAAETNVVAVHRHALVARRSHGFSWRDTGVGHHGDRGDASRVAGDLAAIVANRNAHLLAEDLDIDVVVVLPPDGLELDELAGSILVPCQWILVLEMFRTLLLGNLVGLSQEDRTLVAGRNEVGKEVIVELVGAPIIVWVVDDGVDLLDVLAMFRLLERELVGLLVPKVQRPPTKPRVLRTGFDGVMTEHMSGDGDDL